MTAKAAAPVSTLMLLDDAASEVGVEVAPDVLVDVALDVPVDVASDVPVEVAAPVDDDDEVKVTPTAAQSA